MKRGREDDPFYDEEEDGCCDDEECSHDSRKDIEIDEYEKNSMISDNDDVRDIGSDDEHCSQDGKNEQLI